MNKRELTVLQRRYLAGRRKGWTKIDSALEAGYSYSVALNVKQKIESVPAVRRALDRWLEREGLDDRALGID